MSDHQEQSRNAESDGSYVVVARRYRPRGFDELVGQEHVGQALINAIETNRVGHAYLFTGARGVGKTSTARIFAKALNDPGGPTANPDNTSDVALAIDSGEDIDVIEIDGASNRGIDEIRSLRANVGVRPSRSRYKIYIIDEVHMLTGAAFNALLKTLEEPPEHVKFIFCTTDPEKLPITVLSRCQRFDFAPVEVAKIVGRLREIVDAESASAEEAALELIARRAAGSMRDSQSLLEQVLSFSGGNLSADQVHAMLGTADDERLHQLATALADRDAAAALKQLDGAIDAGVDAGRIAEQLLGYFRDLMAVTVGCDVSLQRHTAASMHGELAELGNRWGLQTVLAVVGLLDNVLVRIRQSVYGRVLLESALIQVCHLPDLQQISNLAAAAAQGETPPAEKKNVAHQPSAEVPTLSSNISPLAKNQHVEQNRKHDRENARETEAPNELPPLPDRSPLISTDAETPAPTEEINREQPTQLAAPPNEISPSQSVPSEPAGPSRPIQTSPGTVAAASARLTSQSLGQIWSDALASVEPMTATIAGTARSVDLVQSDEIRLNFPAEAAMSMRRLEMPEHKDPLCSALRSIVGYQVKLKMVALAPARKANGTKPATRMTGKEKLERMRAIESHPMVQACKLAFGAEIIKVDHPQ